MSTNRSGLGALIGVVLCSTWARGAGAICFGSRVAGWPRNYTVLSYAIKLGLAVALTAVGSGSQATVNTHCGGLSQ